jgi:hypothetical protein
MASKFQHRHYEAIAEVIKVERGRLFRGYTDGRGYGAEAVALELADLFARDNPRFDRARFLSACGLAVDLNNPSLDIVERGFTPDQV